MRCKKHLSDLSSSVGVCASCLRERLLALIAAQAQAQHQASQLNQSHSRAATIDERLKQDQPPPLVFPRSVSPYVTRRKSDPAVAANWSSSHHHRFYSTPQVGPTSNGYYSTSSAATTTGNFASKKKTSKFSLFSNLFKSRSDKYNSDLKNSDPRDPYRDSCETSSSFFSTVFSSRRKKQSTVSDLDNPTAGDRRDCRISNRGMSPERGTEIDEDCDRSPWGSGGSSEECRKTPMSTAQVAVRKSRNGHHHHHSRNVSGLTFCLSPLVRASPNRLWNQKGGLPPDMAFSGDLRAPSAKPHLASAASLCANRSRKLADFGRVNHNR
ncbi:hypothetical protein ACOSQ2_003906 [Xanthoceras sorbifolium]